MALVTLPDVTAPKNAPHSAHTWIACWKKHARKAPSVLQLPTHATPAPCKLQCKPQRPV